KEAAIKAYSRRRLHPRDISILPPLPTTSGPTVNKPIALIDPPRRIVKMSRDVARIRGLTDGINASRSSNPEKSSTLTGAWARWNHDSTSITTPSPSPTRSSKTPSSRPTNLKPSTRFLALQSSDRQVVDISISHEEDYAMAVCLAPSDLTEDPVAELQAIIDHGSGEAIHEPELGDRDF
ncbi:MAG: hypothetical protein Q9187_008372, partial [Circinaria calcarea]